MANNDGTYRVPRDYGHEPETRDEKKLRHKIAVGLAGAGIVLAGGGVAGTNVILGANGANAQIAAAAAEYDRAKADPNAPDWEKANAAYNMTIANESADPWNSLAFLSILGGVGLVEAGAFMTISPLNRRRIWDGTGATIDKLGAAGKNVSAKISRKKY